MSGRAGRIGVGVALVAAGAVSLLALPAALILARWFPAERVRGWRPRRLAAHLALVLALGIPGVAVTIYDEGAGWDWLWTLPAPDDYSRAALLGAVAALDDYIAEHGEPVIIAPGLQPLPFFFPMLAIDVTTVPRRFADRRIPPAAFLAMVAAYRMGVWWLGKEACRPSL